MDRCLFIISALALIASASALCSQDRIGNTTGFPAPMKPTQAPPGVIYFNWNNPCGFSAPYLAGAEASMCSLVMSETPLVTLNSKTQVTVSSIYGGVVNVIAFCSVEKPKEKIGG